MNKTGKIILIVIVVIIAGFLLWRGAHNKNSAGTTNKNNQTLRIGLNPWIGNGLYYVAKEKGFFDKEGINADLQSFDDGAVGKQLLNTNQIDVLPLTPETAVVEADAGVKVKIVGMSDSSQGADGIIASQNIKTITDLKGKKVAFEVGSPSHFFVSYLLDKQGLSTKDLTVVNETAPDAGASFVAGKVDAAVTWQPWLSKATERPGGHLLVSSKVLPIFPDMLIFRADYVQNHPQEARAMLRAMFAARDWILANQNEANGIIAKAFSISNQDVQDQLPDFKWLSYQDNLNAFNSNEPRDLLQKAGDLWFKLGLIKNPINANDLVDGSLLKNLY